MDLSKILSISGKPGLYKMLAQTKNGMVVESLSDGKRFTAFVHERVSSLEEISIYTNDEDLLLKDVLKSIFEKQNGEAAISYKSDPAELKAFFEEAVPDYDKENVYVSDIKKVIYWYNLLQEMGMLEFEEDKEEEKEKPEASKEEPSEKIKDTSKEAEKTKK
ncbi:MAG: DUF5606 domain-containing protein [Bacteroidales bacterium]|nr:DUF5606 domain-containing protein [Bacteroidales bacterium]